MKRSSLLLPVMLIVLSLFPGNVSAQDEPDEGWLSAADYQFGQVMEFALIGESQDTIERIMLLFTAPELETIQTVEVEIEPSNVIDARHKLNLNQVQLAPFTVVTYWWILETESGTEITIPQEHIDYIDDNLVWDGAVQGNIVVHWTGEDSSIGLKALEAATSSMQQITSQISFSSDELIRIYIYHRFEDLQASLRLAGSRDWIGAHARPELGVILISASNTSTIATDLVRDLSHEMTHLILYQNADTNYREMPRWLEEGIATLFEPEENELYQQTLEEALEFGDTIPFQQLCHVFPSEGEQSYLAYAQSASLVNYIQSEFGESAPGQLVSAIGAGANCETVTEEVLGLTLVDLEEEWKDRHSPTSLPAAIWRRGGLLLVAIAVGFLLMSLIVFGLPKAKKLEP